MSHVLTPKRDRLGRPQSDLHRIGDGATLTLLCGNTGMPVKQVPGAFWALDVDERQDPTATVSCPCGQQHVLPLLDGPLTHEDCQRGYWFDGAHVWVLNSPTPVGATPDPEEPE